MECSSTDAAMHSSNQPMPAEGMAQWTQLPVDLVLQVFRFLTSADLVPLCGSCAAWRALVESEQLWRLGCQHRWPEAFRAPTGTLPGAACLPPPFRMPSWVKPLPSVTCLTEVPARRCPKLVPPPPPGSPMSAWRKYYLEHDAYELMNIARAFDENASLAKQHGRLVRALGPGVGVSPLISAASAESDHALGVLLRMRHLKHLTLTFPLPPPHHTYEHSGQKALGEMESLSHLKSLWLSEPPSHSETTRLAGVVHVLEQRSVVLDELDISGTRLRSEDVNLLRGALAPAVVFGSLQ